MLDMMILFDIKYILLFICNRKIFPIMKRLVLDLNKMASVRLTSENTLKVYGGGEARSDRRSGACRYSRKHPETTTCVDGDGHEFPCTTSCASN